MDEATRAVFDQHLEEVLDQLPPLVHRLLEETPLIVEDHPSAKMLRQLGLRHRSQLCGLYRGVPLTRRSIELSGVPTDVVYLFREGVMSLAQRKGKVQIDELREQIRITILHELGHHHGMTEEDLDQLGYG